jgi:hypothetical protein
MAKQNLVKLAKGNAGKTTTAKPKTTKAPAKKAEKPLTPAQERDLKAKQKVEELLQDVELTPKKDEELLEVESEPIKGVDWLEEQVTTLSDENTRLKGELTVAKRDYEKLFAEFQKVKTGGVSVSDDSALKVNIIKLFNEIQANHMALGRNFVIVPPAFLNRLIMFFPFLNDEKKF